MMINLYLFFTPIWVQRQPTLKTPVETDFQAHSIHDENDDYCSIMPSANDSTLQKVPEPLKNSSGYRLNMIIMKDFALSLCFFNGTLQADTSRNKWRSLYFVTIRLFLINLKVSNLFLKMQAPVTDFASWYTAVALWGYTVRIQYTCTSGLLVIHFTRLTSIHKKIGIVGYWATSISTVRSTVLSKKSDK